MKRSVVSCSLGLILLAGTTVWSAPAFSRPGAGKAKVAHPAAITAITVYEDDGGRGGINGGAGESWTLRPNGSVSHSVSVSGFDSMEMGDIFTPNTSGKFNPWDFKGLAGYLESSHVLDMKVPESQEQSNGLNISMVRGGKTRSIRIPDDTSSPAATAASWATLTLVRGIMADVDWKNPAGHSINTGIDGNFSPKAEGLTKDEAYGYHTPVFSVRTAAGKEVGTLQQTSSSGYFRLVLPPGTYSLTRAEPGANGDSAPPGAKAYAWRAPAQVEVHAGHYTMVTISLQKMPSP